MNGFLHQVHCTQRMTETAVHRTRVNEVRQAELTNTVETLHVRMLQHIVYQVIRDGQKTEDRVVNDFSFIGHTLFFYFVSGIVTVPFGEGHLE